MYLSQLVVCAALAQLPPAAHVPRAPADTRATQRGAINANPGREGEAGAARGSDLPATSPPVGRGQAAAGSDTVEPGNNVPNKSQSPGHSSASADGEPLVPVEPHKRTLTAMEIVTAALVIPEGEKVGGRPLALVAVLRSVADRTAQLRATESYWKLVEALADYNFTWDEYQQLERLKPATAPDEPVPPEQQIVATRLAAAKARLQDAELTLVGAQWDLAGAIRLPPGQALPLPADAPHVGAYRTVLDQIYAGRTVPARAVLIDRTLPIRRGAIDARAAAIQAAGDALAATEEAYYEGRGDLALVLSLVDELARQRRAFLTDVRLYNNEIAEYALAAPTPAMDPQGLASMLIKPGASRQGAVAGGAAAQPGGVERAGFNEPMPSTTPGAAQPLPETKIPLAPPPDVGPPQSRGEPTPAPPRSSLPAAGSQPAAQPPARSGTSGDAQPKSSPRFGETSAHGPASATLLGSAAAAAQSTAEASDDSDETSDGRALRRAPNVSGSRTTVRRPAPAKPADRPGAAAAQFSQQPLYPALRNKSPGEQARHLATVLCWDPSSAEGEVTPVSLAEYLATIPAERRGEALVTYWQTDYYAARALVLAQQCEQLEALGAIVANIAAEAPQGTASLAMLLVRAAQLAAEADARRAQVDRLAAQWALTMSAGRSFSSPWLATQTTPHASGYRLQLNELPRELLDSPLIGRLATTIPQLRNSMVERAASVVSADGARAAIEIASANPLLPTRQALTAIADQTAETVAFLARLTEYNVHIASYANAVLPPATTSQTLVRALVATGSAGRP